MHRLHLPIDHHARFKFHHCLHILFCTIDDRKANPADAGITCQLRWPVIRVPGFGQIFSVIKHIGAISRTHQLQRIFRQLAM
jgi:hypothetical protein